MSNKIKQEFMSRKDPVRLNKYLSEAGVCSRREADRLIESGRVKVDGKTAGMGMKVLPGQEVRVGRKVVSRSGEMVVLAVNKPVGIVCTEAHRERNSIVRFLNYPVRVTYVGRLDKDSRGLLLMTNNGDIINKMMRAGNRHEKEYKVTVDQAITPDFLEKMSAGVPILDTVTRPCSCLLYTSLYFPKINTEYDSIEGTIKLYNNQVFIADNIKEVIPEFLMILKGEMCIRDRG